MVATSGFAGPRSGQNKSGGELDFRLSSPLFVIC